MKTIFNLISDLISLYSTVLWIRIILGWIPSRPSGYNQYGQYVGSEGSVLEKIKAFLGKITDPYLNFFRGSKLVIGRVDFSPLLAFMVLNFGKSVFSILSQNGTITIGLIIALVLQNLWIYLFSYILLAIVIMLGVRLVASANYNITNFLDPILNGPVCLVWKIFYGKQSPSEKKLVVTSFIFYLVLYIGIKRGLSYLITYLAMI